VFSKRRDQGSASSCDYRVTLYEPLKNIVAARLVQAVIPNAARNITLTNNRFKFSILRPEQLQVTVRFQPGVGVELEDGTGSAPTLVRGATYTFTVAAENAGVTMNLTDSRGYVGYAEVYFATSVTTAFGEDDVTLNLFSGGGELASKALPRVSTHMHEVTMTPGMYSTISLISKLSELLQDSGTVLVPDPWSVKYLSAEMKFMISPNIDLTSGFFGAFFDGATPHEVMGFSLGTHAGQAVSDKMPVMGGTLCYKLHVAELVNPSHTFAATEPHPFTFVVPVTANMGDTVVADPHQTSHTRIVLNPPVKETKRLSTRLLDDDGAVIDMQDQDHYLCIEVVTLSGI
jgi:hypothetical protein